MAWEWLWLAMMRVATESFSLLVATLMLTRLACDMRSEAVLMPCWNLCAASEASLCELLWLAEAEALPEVLE